MKRSNTILLVVSILILGALIFALTPSAPETIQSKKLINAPEDTVWAVISDVGNYHKYATGLKEVSILSGVGMGMVRSCSDGNHTWTETCTKWDPGSSYSFDVNMESEFPFPFKLFNGTWAVNSQNDFMTLLTITFEYQFPQRWMKWLYNTATTEAIKKGNEVLFDNWEKKIMSINHSHN